MATGNDVTIDGRLPVSMTVKRIALESFTELTSFTVTAVELVIKMLHLVGTLITTSRPMRKTSVVENVSLTTMSSIVEKESLI